MIDRDRYKDKDKDRDRWVDDKIINGIPVELPKKYRR